MLETGTALKRTPFYPRHVALKARLVSFAGYEMPIQYEGIVAEHRLVRSGVGVFDVSHMGEIWLRGSGAAGFANRLVTAEVASIPEGKAVYTALCRDDGGILDDLLVYAVGEDRLLVVNAANFEKDLAWVNRHAPAGVTVSDEHGATAQLAVQGPLAEAVVARVYGEAVSALGFYEGFVRGRGPDWSLISRTGYTGEDGFEIYVPAERALGHWDRIFEAGVPEGIRAVGLGARDTLRLEMGYCLYGNDIDEGTNPIEAGLGWAVRFDKGPFIGREALVAVREAGARRRLGGLVLDGDRIARPGAPVYAGPRPIGTVTSGSMGISVGRPIALAYLAAGIPPGARVDVEVRGERLPALVAGRPMYRGGSLRSPKARRMA